MLEGDGCKKNEPEAVALLRYSVFGRRDEVEQNVSDLKFGGTPDAQYQLGLCYQRGRGIQQNLNLAFALFCNAASGGGGNIGPTSKDPSLDARALLEYRGHSGAQIALADMFERGMCVKRNFDVARALLAAAAEGCSGDEERKNNTTGGDPEAHFLLAQRFEKGRNGYPLDLTAAVRHYRSAANDSHPRACLNLAGFYASGEGGVSRDLASAVDLCVQAAEIGDADAQHACGIMCRDGVRDFPMPTSSRTPTSRDGGGGLPSPHSTSTAGFSSSSPSSIGSGAVASLVLPTRSFELASPSGSTPMAPAFGSPMSPHNAREVESLGSPISAHMPKAGGVVLVPRDPTKAVEWWHKAVEQGHGAAQYDLGRAYAYGIGVERDDERALFLWNLAGFQGDILSHESNEAERRVRASIATYPHSCRVEPYWLFSILDRDSPITEDDFSTDALSIMPSFELRQRHNSNKTLVAGEAKKDEGRFVRARKKVRPKRCPPTKEECERALLFHIAAGDHEEIRKLLDLAIIDDVMAPISEEHRLAVIESGGPEEKLEYKRVGSLSREVNYVGGGKGVDSRLIFPDMDYVAFAVNLEVFGGQYTAVSKVLQEEVGHMMARRKHAEIRRAHAEEERLTNNKHGGKKGSRAASNPLAMGI